MKTDKDAEIKQLRQEIINTEKRYGDALRAKEYQMGELRKKLRLTQKTQDMIHGEYSLEYLPRFVFLLLKKIDRSGGLCNIYLKSYSLINYMFVCGIGVLINMKVLGVFFNLGAGLYASNMLAIIIAFSWNWSLSVGPFGYFLGLSPKNKKIVVGIDPEEPT